MSAFTTRSKVVTGRGWRIAMLVASGLLGSACQPQTAEEKLKAYNERLGPQAQYTGEHLIVRWPAFPNTKKVPAVTLKVPREYLDNPPVFKDDAGGIDRVYLNVQLPDALPWQRMPPVLKTDAPEKVAAAEAHNRKRVFVIIDRDGSTTYAVREGYREEGQDPLRFKRDGEVGGLERYSRLHCLEPQSDAQAHKFVAAKEPDDSSPTNCRLDRQWLILVSTPEVKGDHEGVAIRCMSTRCDAHFLAGNRGGRINMAQDDLPRWKEIVEPVRKRIDSFVVLDPGNS